MYVIARHYGPNKDYISDWCPRWGTAARSSLRHAMRFETIEEAEPARSRAACHLMHAGIRVSIETVKEG